MDRALSSQQVNTLRDRLREIIKSAIDGFNRNELNLIKFDVSERCICAKFASYVEKSIDNTEFKSYNVDVEYNRNEYNIKRLDNNNARNNGIVVDLLVHKRGINEPKSNLICIEMKKGYRRLNKKRLEKDKDRLKNLTLENSEYHYLAGYMILAANSGLRIENEYPQN